MIPFLELVLGAAGGACDTPIAALGKERSGLVYELLSDDELCDEAFEALVEGDVMGAYRLQLGLDREPVGEAHCPSYDAATVAATERMRGTDVVERGVQA